MIEKCLSFATKLSGACALALVLTLAPAKAENVFSTLMAGGLTDASYWDVTLGGGVNFAPKYEGSKKHKIMALPYLDIVWKDTLFLSPIDGAGVNILSHSGFTLGTSAGYDFGRDEKDSKSELNGMGKVKAGAKGTAFLEYDLVYAKVKSSFTKHFGGSKGMTAEFGLKTFLPLSVLMGESGSAQRNEVAAGHGLSGPAISLGISAMWADDKYMKDYFGVSTAQSVSSGKTAFNASEGFKSVTADAGVFVPVNDHVLLGSMVSYTRLIGDAARSPLSIKDDLVSATLFATYKF